MLRVVRIKADEVRVRWAYDESRSPQASLPEAQQEFETYASVLRQQTSRLLIFLIDDILLIVGQLNMKIPRWTWKGYHRQNRRVLSVIK